MGETTLLEKGAGLLELRGKEDLSGKTQELYVCEPNLPDASVQKVLGTSVDTQLLQSWSTNPNNLYQEEQREQPVVRIRTGEQEGCTLTYQKWEGVVKEILAESESFIAHLTDLTCNVPDEQVELPLADIRPDDFELLSVGAVFYCCGLSCKRQIRFQRRLNWLCRSPPGANDLHI